jgi:hypothetical protein
MILYLCAAFAFIKPHKPCYDRMNV